MADRFSLPRDVLLVLNEHEDIEPLLETDARLERALAAEAPSVVASGIGFLLPSAREQARVAQVIRASGTTSGDAQRDIRGRRRDAPDSGRTRSRRFSSACRACSIPTSGSRTTGSWPTASTRSSRRFVVRRDGRYQAVTYLYPQQAVDIDALRRIVRDVDPRLRLTGLAGHQPRAAPAVLSAVPEGHRHRHRRGRCPHLHACSARSGTRCWRCCRRPSASSGAPALLALLRVELDLFSLFAAVTFIGIAVDYGIYVLYRHVFEPSSDMDDVMTRTGAAIIIACATALIGFGTLVNSSYGPLHVFGIVSIVTLSCCLVASIVSLPALVLEMERWSRSAR